MEGSPLGTDTLRFVLRCSLWLFVAVAFLLEPHRNGLLIFELVTMVAILINRGYNIFYAYNDKRIGLTTIMVCVFFSYQPDHIREKVFRYFKYIMVASSIIGIICYISYFANLGIPYTVVPRGDVLMVNGVRIDQSVEWLNYRLCYLMRQYNVMIRFNGIFEEPGWFGTWAAFYLCADDLNIKKRENFILFIAGCLTLSLAYVLLLIIYSLLKNISNWKTWIWVFLLVIIYLFVLPNIKTGNYAIDSLLKRMVITKEGLAGDNRYGSLFAKVWEQTIESGNIYFGYGAGYAEFYGTGEGQGLASIKSYIVNFGIIGTLIIFMPIFLVSVQRALCLKNRLMLLYIIVSFISLYQRPYLFGIPHFIIYLCGISYIKNQKTAQIENFVTCFT